MGALGLPASFPASQTSLLGTPQGQLLLSLSAAPRWRPSERGGEVCVCVCVVCVCVCAHMCVHLPLHTDESCDCDPVLCNGTHLCFLDYVLFPPLPFHTITFCLWENTGTISLGTRLSSWLFLFQPLQTVQSLAGTPLLSVALSLESFREG